ncbi:MAG: DUF4276 family protein [Candidatus Cryptobacteroides sp.]
MKRLIIVAEGQTEQVFINEVLAPYMSKFGFRSITPILIKKKNGHGGLVNYQHLFNTIRGLLASQKNDFIVSTLVDYFRIPNNMPHYDEAMIQSNDLLRADYLQKSFLADINDRRFIPYIQLHEFEALLFSNNNGFAKYWNDDMSKLTKSIVDMYQNPEDINSSPETAPSKRLLAINKKYDKVIDGNLIAIEVGIHEMINKCPRFAKWIDCLISECKD